MSKYPGIRQHVRVMLRDHFQDRVNGDPLWFPGALMLNTIRNGWRYHPHKWSSGPEHCHPDWHHHYPSVDHLKPWSKGGTHDLDNLITLSWRNNHHKSDRSLEAMGWTLREPVISVWDGDLAWFMAEMAADPILHTKPYLHKWHSAARDVLTELSSGGRSPLTALSNLHAAHIDNAQR